MHHSLGMIGIDKCTKESYSMNMQVELNHVCCVCQASLNGEPFNHELQTSHGYCETCLDEALDSIGGQK